MSVAIEVAMVAVVVVVIIH